MKWVKQSVSYWCEDILTGKYTGNGICTAILDTGIARHPDLKKRIITFKNFTGKAAEDICSDDSGHGTHVAGILAGCLVVFAGYWVMQQMLNRRQEVLLSRSGSLQTAEEELTDDDREEEARVKLTAEELTDGESYWSMRMDRFQFPTCPSKMSTMEKVGTRFMCLI